MVRIFSFYGELSATRIGKEDRIGIHYISVICRSVWLCRNIQIFLVFFFVWKEMWESSFHIPQFLCKFLQQLGHLSLYKAIRDIGSINLGFKWGLNMIMIKSGNFFVSFDQFQTRIFFARKLVRNREKNTGLDIFQIPAMREVIF